MYRVVQVLPPLDKNGNFFHRSKWYNWKFIHTYSYCIDSIVGGFDCNSDMNRELQESKRGAMLIWFRACSGNKEFQISTPSLSTQWNHLKKFGIHIWLMEVTPISLMWNGKHTEAALMDTSKKKWILSKEWLMKIQVVP